MAMPYLNAKINYTKNPDTNLFKMHTHNTYEIYCFISGNAKYFIEGTTYALKPNDILIIKKSEAHSLLISSNSPYKRIVVCFNSDALLCEDKETALNFLDTKPLGKNNSFPFKIYNSYNWIYYLEQMCNSDKFEEKRIYLTVFINELSKAYSKLSDNINSNDKSDNIDLIIQYINNNLCNYVDLENISKKFNYSKTHLNRRFNQIFGVTVSEYILTKKIIKSKEMLNNGTPPTQAYISCGFNDYCTFYRNYIKKFGVSPKADYIKFKS